MISFAADWSTVRARFVFAQRDVRGVDAPLASATKDGVVLRTDLDYSVWNPASDSSKYKLVEPNDFVVGLRSFQHGLSHSDVRGLVSPAYTVLRAREDVEPRFYKHYFRSTLLVSQLASITQGIRQGQTIDMEAFGDLLVPVPPVEEQRRIADFLDAETARINQLIELRQRQSTLLNERWQARLSDAATGLIDRYGAVSLRYVLLSVEQGWSPQCDDRRTEPGEWGVVKAGCVNGGVFREDQHKALPAEVEPKIDYQLKSGDLLMSRASGSLDLIGSVAVVPEIGRKLLLCDKVYRLKVDSRSVRAEFVAHMLRTLVVREHIKLGVSGAEGMANNLPTAVVRGCEIPNASLEDQDLTVATLDAGMATVEATQVELKRQVELLEERRRAVVTAAVTGELDVTTARRVS